jgi:2-polyprenyl-6-methoxyphenol hydroxylase-like FAD-dependent oxidoreductase
MTRAPDTADEQTPLRDVVVVGGGPTGMMAAGDLARAGCSVTVLERRYEVNRASRAFATMPSTLEHLESRGIARELLDGAFRAPRLNLFGRACLDLTKLRSPYGFAMVTSQARVDAALERYALSQGAQVRRGVTVLGLAQDADEVRVLTDQGAWRARFALGADGAHSSVRKLLGVDFPGRTVLSSLALADVRLRNGPDGSGLTVGSGVNTLGFLAPYGDGHSYRSISWDRRYQVDDGVSVTLHEVSSALRDSLPYNVEVLEISESSRFHCDERQVDEYRHGRVFLAGDAAHVHSPVGGQGMNTGIQDAVNLAWKVAAVLDGAPEEVLETYHSERHPIGRRVIRQSGLMMRSATLQPRLARAARDQLLPYVLALFGNFIAGGFAGTELRYPRKRSEHALVGTRTAHISTSGGFQLKDGMLIRPDGYIAWVGPGWEESLQRWTGRRDLPDV